jgi:hypothetical protein
MRVLNRQSLLHLPVAIAPQHQNRWCSAAFSLINAQFFGMRVHTLSRPALMYCATGQVVYVSINLPTLASSDTHCIPHIPPAPPVCTSCVP